jgi:hypothetical protein
MFVQARIGSTGLAIPSTIVYMPAWKTRASPLSVARAFQRTFPLNVLRSAGSQDTCYMTTHCGIQRMFSVHTSMY